MRFRSNPTAEQRAALRAQLARLQQPAALLEILQSSLPAGFEPTEPGLVPQLADRARAAFEEAQSDEIASSRLR